MIKKPKELFFGFFLRKLNGFSISNDVIFLLQNYYVLIDDVFGVLA